MNSYWKDRSMGKEHFYEKVSAFLRFTNFRRRAADGLRLCGHFDKKKPTSIAEVGFFLSFFNYPNMFWTKSKCVLYIFIEIRLTSRHCNHRIFFLASKSDLVKICDTEAVGTYRHSILFLQMITVSSAYLTRIP